MKTIARPTVPDVIPYLRSIYARHSAGCCLHILLDDGNVRQADAEFCLAQARDRGHADCLAAAELLVRMTRTQRLKAGRRRA